MKLIEIIRQWLPQIEITQWEDLDTEMDKKLQAKERQLRSDVERQGWRLHLGGEAFISLASSLEIRPLAGNRFDKREPGGRWTSANPVRDFPKDSLSHLQKLSASVIEFVQLQQAASQLPAAIHELRTQHQHRLDAVEALPCDRRHETLGRLHEFYDQQKESLPLRARQRLMEREFQILLRAFHISDASQEVEEFRRQLLDFFRRNKEDAHPAWEKEFDRATRQKDFAAGLEALRQADSLGEAVRQRDQILIMASSLPGLPQAEIEDAWKHSLENNFLSETPLGLKASRSSPEGIRLSWKRSEGATTYLVYRSSADVPGIKSFLASVPASANLAEGGPAFLDTAVVQGLDYFYWVTAKNHKGESAFAEPAGGKCRPLDGQILEATRLAADKGDAEAVARWMEEYPELRDELAQHLERAKAWRLIEPQAASAARSADVVKLAEFYSSNLEHADNLIGFLEAACGRFLDKSKQQRDRLEPERELLAACGSKHRQVENWLKKLEQADRFPKRASRITTLLNENSAALQDLDALLRQAEHAKAEAEESARAEILRQAQAAGAGGSPKEIQAMIQDHPRFRDQLMPLLYQAIQTQIEAAARAASTAQQIKSLKRMLQAHIATLKLQPLLLRAMESLVTQSEARVQAENRNRDIMEEARQRLEAMSSEEAISEEAIQLFTRWVAEQMSNLPTQNPDLASELKAMVTKARDTLIGHPTAPSAADSWKHLALLRSQAKRFAEEGDLDAVRKLINDNLKSEAQLAPFLTEAASTQVKCQALRARNRSDLRGLRELIRQHRVLAEQNPKLEAELKESFNQAKNGIRDHLQRKILVVSLALASLGALGTAIGFWVAHHASK